MPDWGWWLIIGGAVLTLLAFLPGGEEADTTPEALPDPPSAKQPGCLLGWILVLLRPARRKAELTEFPYTLTDEFLSPAERSLMLLPRAPSLSGPKRFPSYSMPADSVYELCW